MRSDRANSERSQKYTVYKYQFGMLQMHLSCSLFILITLIFMRLDFAASRRFLRSFWENPVLRKTARIIQLSCCFAMLFLAFGVASGGETQSVIIVGQRPPGAGGYSNAGAGGPPDNPRNPVMTVVQIKGARLKARTNTNNKDANSCETSKNPVVIATGEKYKEELDFTWSGDYGLSLARYYRSSGVMGMFGYGWLSSLEYPTMIYPIQGCVQTSKEGCARPAVTLSTSNGEEWIYRFFTESTRDGRTVYLYQSDDTLYPEYLTFYIDTGIWQVKRNRLTYQYHGGTLDSITDYNGAKTIFSQPNQVVNGAGQAVKFIREKTANGYTVVTQVIEPTGAVWNYQYNSNGMLSKVISPGENPDIREYHYESPYGTDLLTGISINGVRYSRYSYYSNRQVQRSALENGEETDTFVYSKTPTGSQTTVSNQYGDVTTHTFVDMKGVLKETSVSRAGTSTCPSSVAQTIYDAAGSIDYTIDWNGNKTDYNYDTYGQLASMTIGAGTSNAITQVNTWEANVDIVSSTMSDANGRAFYGIDYKYSYGGPDWRRLLSLKQTDLITGEVRETAYRYTFWPSGVLNTKTVTQLSSTGNLSTTYEYDQFGNLITFTNPLGQQQRWSGYDQMGRFARYTDINGIATDYAYQPNGNLTEIRQNFPDGVRLTRLAYNNMRLPTEIYYPDGRIERFRYTSGGRLEARGDASNNFAHTTIDVMNRIVGESAPREIPGASTVPTAVASGQFSSRVTLDSLGRPYTRSGNNGQNINYRYDSNGNLQTITDAAGHTSKYTYDTLDRLATSTAPDGGQTVFNYDLGGRLASVRDPRGLTTTYAYNGFGDKLSTTSPDTGKTTYAYDSLGRLTSETFADGRTVVYAWDPLDRLQSKSSNGVTTSFIYDEGAFGKGRLTRFLDRTGQTTYSYNASGELLSQTNLVMGRVFNTAWTYDAAGRLMTMAYPSGFMLRYSYDGAGRVSAITSNGAR